MTCNHAGQATFSSKQNYLMFFGYFWVLPRNHVLVTNWSDYWLARCGISWIWQLWQKLVHVDAVAQVDANAITHYNSDTYLNLPALRMTTIRWQQLVLHRNFTESDVMRKMCFHPLRKTWCFPKRSNDQTNPAIPSVVKTSSFPKPGSQNELQVWLWIKAKNPWKKTVRAYGKGLFFKKM